MGEDEEGFEEEGGRGREDERVHQGAEECEDITMLLFFDPLRLSVVNETETPSFLIILINWHDRSSSSLLN